MCRDRQYATVRQDRAQRAVAVARRRIRAEGTARADRGTPPAHADMSSRSTKGARPAAAGQEVTAGVGPGCNGRRLIVPSGAARGPAGVPTPAALCSNSWLVAPGDVSRCLLAQALQGRPGRRVERDA